MKKVLILSFWVFLALPAFAQEETQTLYVAAPGGLSLRSAPSKDSKKIRTIPYGAQIDNCKPNYEVTERIDGYVGSWNEVVYEGEKGYIFEGYTLYFPPPHDQQKNVVAYLQSFLGNPIVKDSGIAPIRSGLSYRSLKTSVFKNQIIYSDADGYEWNQNSILNLDMEIDKAYLLVCLMQKYFVNDGIFDGATTPLSTSFPTKTTSYDKYTITSGFDMVIYNENFWVQLRNLHGRTSIIWGDSMR
jgi:hypothetical protein